ncbi:MAG TPA: YheV family putative metal-binding protein [Pseudomonas xinjiangensis]|uniref:DNA-binding protein n=2 Tax=root TaxID=1 RepID=A0A0F9W2Q5_9ZZZZ|nr:YheV family putative metal-binding protein [Halopseudomonas xinjiangensis]HEC48988.1 YheV family putative metal-binding protein [Halopseudomonas xinjiangensis]
MSETQVIKRFIAGAVCPACSQMDTIRMFQIDGVPNRECVNCGYADTLDERGNSVPREIPTRVNAPKIAKPTAQTQTVQFFPNPRLKKK